MPSFPFETDTVDQLFRCLAPETVNIIQLRKKPFICLTILNYSTIKYRQKLSLTTWHHIGDLFFTPKKAKIS